MWTLPTTSSGHPDDAAHILTHLTEARFFDPDQPLLLARAPGRLDLMGGIADYSGSLVLEWPLAAATWVAAQQQTDESLIIQTCNSSERTRDPRVSFSMSEIVPHGAPLDYQRASEWLKSDPRRAWAAYVAGALVVLHHAYGRFWKQGIKLLVHSDVPVGKGMSSSAALEVASLQAVASLAGIELDRHQLGLLAQKVENAVVGAPCGVMDQMTSACGERNHLTALLCQPAELEASIALPDELEVWGIDSGIRHEVSGRDYVNTRVAAFMGYRIVAAEAGLTARETEAGQVTIEDPAWHGYLANLTPATWAAQFRDKVPETLLGRTFLQEYLGITDPVTRVDPDTLYQVRACAAHPVYEHARVWRFREILEQGARTEDARRLLGSLMLESHASYSACGLGSTGTDRLTALVRAADTEGDADQSLGRGLYGAKIAGAGSGGSIVVLARHGSRPILERIARTYESETGRAATVYGGSSDGAHRFGVWRLDSST